MHDNGARASVAAVRARRARGGKRRAVARRARQTWRLRDAVDATMPSRRRTASKKKRAIGRERVRRAEAEAEVLAPKERMSRAALDAYERDEAEQRRLLKKLKGRQKGPDDGLGLFMDGLPGDDGAPGGKTRRERRRKRRRVRGPTTMRGPSAETGDPVVSPLETAETSTLPTKSTRERSVRFWRCLVGLRGEDDAEELRG